MSFVQFALRRPLTIIMCIVAVVLGAALALWHMQRDIFPPLGIPTIYVAQPYGGMDASQMEGYLTYYYEYHFLYITGIEHVESKSIQSAALIKLQFYPGTDMSQAMSETVSYVNRARAFMPPGTVPPFVMRFDAGSVPVGDLVFSSETRSVGEMQDAALNLVRPLFATLPGVSAPPPFGGSARAIVINVKPERLRAYNMSIDEIVSALAATNTISPSGNALIAGKYPMVPLNSVVKNIKDLESVPIRTGVYPAIFVRDVGQVIDGSDIITSYALVNGRRTVYIPVTKRADASTLAVVNEVKQNLPKFQNALPADIKVSYQFDQSPYATRAISGLTLESALGALLTGVMVLLFLRDWRSAFIVVLNIPLSLLGAILVLWVTGQTINIMTLGGLALAVGILVDMGTVTIENIHSHLRREENVALAVADACAEVALPLMIAMLCVLAVFLPSFFMVGAAKALFVPLSLAVGFSMAMSYLLASTLVPVLSVWMIRSEKDSENKKRIGFDKFQNRYGHTVEAVVNHRVLVVIVYFLLAIVVIWLVGRALGTEIFPKVDTGQIQLRLRAPAGTDVDGTEAIALKTLDLIKREVGPDNVEVTLGFVGVHPSSYPINLIYLWNSGSEEAVMQVQLKSGAKIRVEDLQERLRSSLKSEIPELTFSFEPSDIVSRVMSLGSPTPIEVVVSGPNLEANREVAEKVYQRLTRIAALRDLQFGQLLDYPTVDIGMDRERSGVLGVKITDVSRSLVPATSSSRFTTLVFWADPVTGVAYQVQVQIPQKDINSLEELKNIPVSASVGKSILLRNLADVRTGTAVGEYDRYNMERLVSITANIQGVDLGTVAQEVRSALGGIGDLPPKMSVTVRGQVVPMEQMLSGLKTGLLMAIVMIFILLTANFQSLRLSLIVVSTVPAVIAGVALVLWITQTTLNIQSFMGAIMAIGVAVSNAILLVTFAERSRIEGEEPAKAAVIGARSRLRPILMTSLAMIAGMLPMAFGIGEGSEQTAPLGRAVVGGLIAATMATLLVLPPVFAIAQGRASRRSISLDPHDPKSSYHVQPSGTGGRD